MMRSSKGSREREAAPASGSRAAWLDGFLPEDLESRSGSLPAQVRLIVLGSFVLAAATATALLWRLLAAPMHPVAVVAAGGAAPSFAAAPYLLRITGSVRLAGTVMLLGYPSKERLLQTDVRDLYADPERRLVLGELLAREGFVKSWESELKTFTGESRIVQGTTTIVRDAAGDIAYYLAILRDVTEARFVERDREAVLAALAARNDDLRQIHRAVGHDLKSPLFTLKGFLGLLGKDLDDGKLEHARKDLATVKDVTNRVARLVEELLDFSRIERHPEEWDEVELASVVDEVLTLLEGRIRDAGAVVEVGELKRLRGDVALLRTIFQNLIENAVRFCTGREEPRVEVGARHVGAETIFYVADSGTGIAPENQEKVFALFQTAGSELGGTGIGLATVKRAVEVHGGRIWVESEGEGKGATFFFTLPGSGPSIAG